MCMIRYLLKELEAPKIIYPSARTVRGKEEYHLYSGTEGSDGSTTMYCKVNFPVSELIKLKGEAGEEEYVKWEKRNSNWTPNDSSYQWYFGNYTKEEWQVFINDIAKRGIKSPILLMAWPRNTKPYITGGNHRIHAASQLGIKSVYGELVVRGHAERRFSGYWRELLRKAEREDAG